MILIVRHFFCICIALVLNNKPGKSPTSPLTSRIHHLYVRVIPCLFNLQCLKYKPVEVELHAPGQAGGGELRLLILVASGQVLPQGIGSIPGSCFGGMIKIPLVY